MPADATSDRAEPPPDDGHVAYFGYGSLVNRATHRTGIVSAVPARLKGWRRVWRPRPDMPGFPAALLTVRPDPDAACDGLLVFDHAANLAAVDVREARYDRSEVPPEALQAAAGPAIAGPVWVYAAQAHLPPHPEPPRILRSYLDAVMQGIFVEHGVEGLRRFLAETESFDIPIEEDRDQPVYPRAVGLTDAERALFDELTASLTARRPKG